MLQFEQYDSDIYLKLNISRLLEVQLVDFPTSSGLTHLWGLGSVLGMYFAAQIASGLLISLNYVSAELYAYVSVLNLVNEASLGWLVYLTHSIGAGTVFFIMYMHIGKYYMVRTLSMYSLLSGSIILILTIVSSFLGYVLLWLQMSYWAATVITTLLSVLPDGNELLTVLWGNFTLDGVTLTRFYSLHYLVTLVTGALAVVHLVLLHILGSTPNYVMKDSIDAIPFSRYYLIKDVLLFAILYLAYINILYINTLLFSDAELAISVNTMSTPPHIVPEWYLLMYYACLRGIPSKLLGVCIVALLLISLFTAVIV